MQQFILFKVLAIPHKNLGLNLTPSNLIQATCLHRSHTEYVLCDIIAPNVLETAGYKNQHVGRVKMMVWPHSNKHEGRFNPQRQTRRNLPG